MYELHNGSVSKNTSEKGQLDLLGSSNKSAQCPSLSYQIAVSADGNVDKAYDILFKAISRVKKESTYDDT